MAKGMYHYIRKAWQKPDAKTQRERMVEWRKEGTFTRVEKPLRLDRARSLGYKDKKGFIVIRVKLLRGGHKKARPNKGRRSKRMTIRKTLKLNYKGIAEQRVAKKYPTLEVLNSYNLGKDGIYYFFEVLAVDPKRPEIKNDKTLSWIQNSASKNKPLTGLTSAGKKSRGLRDKSPMNKRRPSVRKSRTPRTPGKRKRN